MPIPWICAICGKMAFTRLEMCAHLKEEYMDAVIRKDTNKNTANDSDDHDTSAAEHSSRMGD